MLWKKLEIDVSYARQHIFLKCPLKRANNKRSGT